jgi:cysteinyl-tRNA synthetase
MRWNSPWSVGFPGWHLECSVMSTKYLGRKYDIHGGGMDLLFPHHEAEIAQANACNCQLEATDQDEATYWLHNNMITYQEQKMGKSLGNAIDLKSFYAGEHWTEPRLGLKLRDDLPQRTVEKDGQQVVEYNLLMQPYSPMVLRFFMLQAHYRSTLDFSNEALQGSEKALQRLNEALKRLDQISTGAAGHINEEFEANIAGFMGDVTSFMNDDFNTARVIARMFEVLPVINQLHKDKSSGFSVRPETFEQFRQDFQTTYSAILGLQQDAEGGTNGELVDGLMEVLLKIRASARTEKNWPVSDLIRDKLNSLRIKLEDSPEGTDWYYEN